MNIPIRDDGQPYKISSLYKDQQEILLIVLHKIREWIECRKIRNLKPLMMTVNRPGGSGKSVLIQTTIAVLRTQFNTNNVALVAAPTGSAAFNVNWEKLHLLLQKITKGATWGIARPLFAYALPIRIAGRQATNELGGNGVQIADGFFYMNFTEAHIDLALFVAIIRRMWVGVQSFAK